MYIKNIASKVLSFVTMFMLVFPSVVPTVANATVIDNNEESCVPVVQTIVSSVGDDTDNGDAVATSFEHEAWYPSASLGSGADWIWHEALVSEPTADDTTVFTKTVNVPGTFVSANIEIAADNGFALEVNDVVVDDNLTEEENYGSTVSYPLTLNSGNNTLEITVKNFGLAESTAESNPAGLLYKLVVESENCDATISAVKIVCSAEEYLPNWGNNGASITSTTADKFLAEVNDDLEVPVCWEEDWTFEWAPQTEVNDVNPGNNEGDQEGWTNFNGTATGVPVGGKIWVREVWNDDYIPFSGDLTSPYDSVSAELYCHTDVLHYDNFDFINPVVAGETYHCVGFNVEVERPVENSCPEPSTLEDSTVETINVTEEESLQSILDGESYGVNVTTDQKQYQLWSVDANSEVVIDAKFIERISAHNAVFGYYTDGSMTNFVPVFKTSAAIGGAEPVAVPGNSFTVNTGTATTIGFAMKSYDGTNALVGTFATENSLSDGPNDQAVVYNPSSDTYVVAFEDLTAGDFDYNDLVVEVALECADLCDAKVELIQNGGFETPAVSANSYTIFPNATPLLEWAVAWVGAPESGTEGLEIQDNVAGAPYAGDQHAELDGDHPVKISQVVPTLIGETYNLEFAYSPRPGVGALDNEITVKAGGNVLGALLSVDGTANGDTDWDVYTRSFVATSTSTTIEFVDTGTDTSLGGYLDEVSLTCNPDADDSDPETGRIVVNKVTNPEGDEQSFAFVTTGAGYNAFNLTDLASPNDQELEAGNYSVVETAVAGWTQTSATCSSNLDQANESPDNISLQAGEILTCTFTNTKSEISQDLPECSDGQDNDGDELADANDPGCRNPNSDVYDPNDDDEENSGGGGGGGGFASRSSSGGEVLGAADEICNWNTQYLRRGWHGNVASDVETMQNFLNLEMDAGLAVDKNFGPMTEAAVRAFQVKYMSDILTPWGLNSSTGIWYLSTTTKAKEIMCGAKNALPTLINWSQNPAVR